MPLKNLFNKGPKEEDLFTKDDPRSNRSRSDVKPVSRKRMLIETIIIFVVLFIFVYFIIASLFGFLWSVIASFMANDGVMSKILPDVNSISFQDARHKMLFEGPELALPFLIAFVAAFMVITVKMRYDKRRIAITDHTDTQTHKGDRKKLETFEITTRFEAFPDRGAHSRTVSPTAIVSHIFLKQNWRLGNVELYRRNDDGSYVLDDNGHRILDKYPLIDESSQEKIYSTALGIKNKKEHIAYDPFKVPYKTINGKSISLGDFIKDDWYIPPYENQRPTGAFLVETGAVNSFVIAITRGNKGQLAVNNTIDNLSREGEPQNMFINDPKGELFAGFHKLLENRGYEVVVLNLLNYNMTHQFNVLGPGVANARIGDLDKMDEQLNTVINTFFPIEGDDPFWGQAQQALVRMIVFAMIDFYIEEEKEYIQLAAEKDIDESRIGRDLDNKWRHVTMYNAYQMLTVMSRKEVWFNEEAVETGKMIYNGRLLSQQELADEKFLKETLELPPSEQMTQLTAFFKLLGLMPRNKMRTMTLQQNDAMSLMADSEKTRATVYGIALVAMLFFTRRPITAITSASPRQSLDPISLSFPRRLRFKINLDYIKQFNLIGQTVVFESYRDEAMTDKIEQGDDFEHKTKLDELGWVEYRFKGIYEEYDEVTFEEDGSVEKIPKPIYIKMKLLSKNNLVMETYCFEFTRGYAKTADGKQFLINPRTGERTEQGGTLRVGTIENGKFVRGQNKVNVGNGLMVYPIEQTDPVYNVKPKAIFSITPPHLLDYVKIVIVMISVLFDTSVGESYVTKESGKPLYKIRSILDELGNLQFNGVGIPGFQTKLSIGLGQGQEFLMVLQTLQRATCCIVKSYAVLIILKQTIYPMNRMIR